MLRRRFLGSIISLSVSSMVLASTALANPPKVVADIAPVHSLVAQVMEGVATPTILIQPEASPHSYSLRPSEARALSESDIVFLDEPRLNALDGKITRYPRKQGA